MTRVGKLVAGAVFIAFGVVLPMVFHFVGAMGSVFLPMHIPVLIAGLFLGPRIGCTAGLVTPVLSCLLTGMPPVMPVLPFMTLELAIYGLIGGYMYQTRRRSLVVALIAALLAGRIAALAGGYGIVSLLHIKLDPLAYIAAGVVTGLPGIAIQLIVVPFLVKRMEVVFYKNKHQLQESVGSS